MQLVWCNPNLQKPRDPNIHWKHVDYTFLKAETFTVAAKLMTAAVHVWSQRGWGDSLAS